jgi:threonine/homoserine/homoserine lactone efflux protein
MSDPLLFLLAVATVLLTPGPTNTLMATAGATGGVRRSLPLLGAELSAYLIAIFAYRAVLGPLVAAYPAVGVGLKIAVAAYLVWLAVKLWRRPVATAPVRVTFAAVFTTTLLNPKALIFALTIFPAAAGIWYFAEFSAAVLVAGVAWICLGFGLEAAVGTGARWIPRVASVALVGFAGYIAASVV